MSRTGKASASLGLVIVATVAVVTAMHLNPSDWSTQELIQLRSMSLARLPATPIDPTNHVQSNLEAQEFGHQLFFDTRLSGNGQIACATCHQPNKRFTDSLPVSRAIGTTKRNAPSLVGLAHSPWLYWDGRKDSLWAQALAPLEDAAEHGGSRLQYVHFIASDPIYSQAYGHLFGALPDLSDVTRFPPKGGPVTDATLAHAWQSMTQADRTSVDHVFANIGKAIAAYETLLVPGPSRFDAYVDGMATDPDTATPMLSAAERRGLRLFIGVGNCTQCHNGPLLTNNSFHNTGIISAPGKTPDLGRVQGVRQVTQDPFNCLGRHSDDTTRCEELRFAKSGDDLIGAFRTPSLRNIRGTAPFAHAGQLPDLRGVLEHYDRAPDSMIGHNEAKPLGLWPWEIGQIEVFLLTLQAPPATHERWLTPPN